MEEKLSWLLESHYNVFHADMISRAIYDNTVRLIDNKGNMYNIINGNILNYK